MTASAYPRDRVDNVLVKTKLTDGYTVLYAAPDFTTAFIETVVRDRFTRKGLRKVLLKEVTERAWTHIRTKPRFRLRLLDLRQDGCVRLGAPTDAVNARNHAAGRALGRAIHAEQKDVDGFLFSSRLTAADAYALFDRALAKLEAAASGMLRDHPELPGVLSKYSIQLVAT